MADQLPENELCERFGELGFVTLPNTMTPLLRQADKAARVSDITVLLEGETGTGKQVLARAIHQLDHKRQAFPFITAHCSSITEALAESELFGHEKGAFSGAIKQRKGLFQAAHKGTLFLDDVNELPLNVQTKLLDVLQRQVLRPVGADREMRIDTRIIAAANQPLAILVQQQRFRADLYHRLNVVRLVLPPLRKRPRDLPALVLTFAHRHRHIYPDIEAVDRELTQHLEVQPFEGNLRELEHAVQRMLFLKTEGATLVLSDWQAQDVQFFGESNQDLLRTAAEAAWRAIRKGGMTYGMALRQIERNLLEAALSGANTRREAAARLQTSERTLYHKLRFHGLSRASGRAQATANSR